MERRPARNTPGGRAQKSDSDRPIWQQRVARQRDPEREKSPLIPEEITPMDVDLGVRVQLKTLTPENADMVARHLAMVRLLIEDDPVLAHKHALAAARRAGRIAVVRETVGITAYSVGDYALALRELLAQRRISGSNDQIPLIVDSERGMGRPEKALKMGREVDRKSLSPAVRVNLAIVMSGARLDLGYNELALAELEIPELNPQKVFSYSPALFRAYADTLDVLGRKDESNKWFELAERAVLALTASPEDVLEVIEEIEIPKFTERAPREDGYKPRSNSRDGARPERGGYDRPRREGDRPSRPGQRPTRDGDRPSRSTDRPSRSTDRPARSSDRPTRDGDRPRRDSDRPKRSGERSFGSSDRPKRDGERPARSGERSARPTDRSSDRPARSSDRPSRDDRAARSNDRPVRDGDKPRPSGERSDRSGTGSGTGSKRSSSDNPRVPRRGFDNPGGERRGAPRGR